MGKKQHQKDKMYLTCTEWKTFYGGKKTGPETSHRAEFRKLPFHHCALTFQPFQDPMCTPEGIIYDSLNIVQYIQKFGTDPATGKKLDLKSLTKLNFYKNSDGKYHCPIMYKVFNENSHIVAIRKTGNVYSFEAVEQLNLKNKNFKDLINDEPFTRADIIHLQDPTNLEKSNINNFYHLKNNIKVESEEELKARENPQYYLKSVAPEAKHILSELYQEYKPSETKEEKKIKADKLNSAHYSSGMVAAGFTSTTMEPCTTQEAAVLEDDVVRYARVKKKGYVQMLTSAGPLNLELHCDLTPKTCENFIKLCRKGYYNNTIFHRSIRNFMIQGGDPEGTGKGGESFWGKPFKDEFKPNLVHQGRGILSMANSGPDSNKSQFFITFRSCRHLDNKHTVFGKVVGGLDTLNILESIETDNKDCPIETIKILTATVFVDPYEEVDEELAKERETLAKEEENEKRAASLSIQNANKKLKVYHDGVGKYIDFKVIKDIQKPLQNPKYKKVKETRGFDFNNWK